MTYYQPVLSVLNTTFNDDSTNTQFKKMNPDNRYSLNELFPGVTKGAYVKFHDFSLDYDGEQIVTFSFHKDCGQGTPFEEVLSSCQTMLKMDKEKRQFYVDTKFGLYYLSKGDLEIIHKLKENKK